MKPTHRTRLQGRSLRRRAFTLIELIVVILILAILATLIVPRVISRTEDAKQSKALSDLASLRSMLDQFRIDNGRYPASEEGLESLRTQPADAPNWRGPYSSKAIPLDPWGNDYIYEWPGSNGEDSFLLLSLGADGQEGGEGNAADIIESE
ncbi:MAG: type II secretion system major pseudopilin GspG [Fimbriimonadaceae bacterium]|nr:type II secretion system major pseudopilin GspG [Fimbriimonadaceae bacterium]